MKPVTIVVGLTDKVTGPLSQITAKLTGFVRGIQAVGSKLAPITSQFTAIGGAVAGIVGGTAAIAAAEKQVQAERRLLSALGNRLSVYKEVEAAVQQITKEVGGADEVLLAQAATLANMGISAAKIPEGLRAAVDTAAALQIPLEAAAKGIGLFNAGRAGELGERIPELAELAKQGRLAADGVALLRSKFGGTGAEIASTAFGQAAASANVLGDSLEEVGKGLVAIKTEFIKGLIEPIKAFGQALQNPGFQEFAVGAAKVAAVVATVSAAVLLLSPVLRTIGGALGGVLSILLRIGKVGISSVFGALASPKSLLLSLLSGLKSLLGSIGRLAKTIGGQFAIAATAIATMANLSGALDGINGQVDAAASQFGKIFSLFSRGEVGFDKVFRAAILYVKRLWDELYAKLFLPIQLVFESYGAILKEGYLAVVNGLGYIGTKAVSIGRKFLEIFSNVSALGSLSGVKGSADQLDDAAKVLADRAAEAGGKFLSALGGEDSLLNFYGRLEERVSKIVNKGAKEAADLSLDVQDEIEAREAKRLADRRLAILAQERSVSALEDQVEELLQRSRAASFQTVGILDLKPSEVDKFLGKVDTELKEPISKILSDLFSSQFRDGIISAKELSGALADIQSNAARTRKKQLDDEIREIESGLIAAIVARENLPSAILAIPDGLNPAEADRLILDQRQAYLEAEEKSNSQIAELRKKQLSATRDLARVQVALIEQSRSEAELRREIGQQVIESGTKQAELVASGFSTLAEDLKSGAIDASEAVRRLANGTTQINQIADKARESIEALFSVEGGRTPEALRGALQTLRDIVSQAGEARRALAQAVVESATASADAASRAGERALQAFRDRRLSGAEAFDQINQATSDLETRLGAAKQSVAELLNQKDSATVIELGKLTMELDRLQEQSSGVSISLAQDIVAVVEESSSNIDEVRSKFRQLASEGRVYTSEAIAKEREAIAAFEGQAGTAIDLLNQIKAQNPEIEAQIDRILEKIAKIREARALPPDSTFGKGLDFGIEEVVSRFDTLGKIGAQAGSQIANGFLDFFDVLVTGSEKVSTFAVRFVRDISLMIAKLIIFKAISSVLGFGKGGEVGKGGEQGSAGGLLGFLGGLLPFATGGQVPGVDTGRDKVPALLRPLEWVIRPEAVLHYGSRLFAGLNSMIFPRDMFSGLKGSVPEPITSGHFAGGGQVGAGSSSPMPTLVADPVTLARLLAGGEAVMREFMRRNADTIANAPRPQ